MNSEKPKVLYHTDGDYVPKEAFDRQAARITFLEDEIKALTHKGRKGKLEQANVNLADRIMVLEDALRHLYMRLNDGRTLEPEGQSHYFIKNILEAKTGDKS